ncbi:antitoxin protein of toxin-antitoxin system [Nocardia tenerifensis]|uniref:Antitoxin protein of toxin-antitoxin system n=1 Tax=Nocardia tenerifensis TaxID=228006 RepID=A0A318K3T9_9NOCA|nr:antitoxin protein of toxin-antitoxin system [Nocardia tenerifensis]
MDFKDLANKAMDLAQQHADKVETVIDKAGDLVDQKTDGKYASQVDSAQEAAKKALHQQK